MRRQQRGSCSSITTCKSLGVFLITFDHSGFTSRRPFFTPWPIVTCTATATESVSHHREPLTMAFLSTTNAPGTRAYTSVVCENNWFEERARIEAGERVYIGCMEGAYLRPEDPDLSIAPDYRNPEVPADGRLVMPHRSWRSRTTFDSSRQGADDGFRIYSSLSGDDYCPIEKRGNSQLDDLRKTRSATVQPMATTARIANREKNAMFEQARICDGEL